MKLKVVGPDGASNPTMEQAVRRNIWIAFGSLGIVVPVVGTILGGLAVDRAPSIMIAVGINGDTGQAAGLARQVRRRHPGPQDRLIRLR